MRFWRTVLLTLGGAILGSALSGHAAAAGTHTPPARPERLLPRFEGPALTGGRIGTEHFHKRRGVVFVFSSSDPDVAKVAAMIKGIQQQARPANIALLGVSRDLDADTTRSFLRQQGLDFPVLLDPEQSVSGKLGLPHGVPAVIIVNAQGSIVSGFAGLQGDEPDIATAYESEIRRVLRLKDENSSLDPGFGIQSTAPDFQVQTLEGQPLRLADLHGKVGVIVFFLPTCPHCHRALQFLDQLVRRLANPDLRIVPISISNRRYVLEDMVGSLGIQLPMYVDPEGQTQRVFEHSMLVPDILVLNRDSRISARHSGIDGRIEAQLTMEIREALGVKNPLLLDKVGYSGADTCRICHSDEHQTWELTTHAYAFETLVEHGSDRDPECLSCHTVGWKKPGGYSLETPKTFLEGVQCENCHGRGGPHQSASVEDEDYSKICATCHTPEHSLHFRYAERLPIVSHEANEKLTRLSVEERRALLAKRSRRERTLFAPADYVGSSKCQQCHESEFEIWSQSPHASAWNSLTHKSAENKPDCQRCHTTGFQQDGGFPQGGPALREVGCESCHGPGGKHVEQAKPRAGTILGLSDKCESCVILEICGTCHDDKNDPDFEFEVNDKIDLIRHGSRKQASRTP